MGLALDTVSGRVDSVGATLTAVTNDTGDSNVVRNFGEGGSAHIVDANALVESAAVLQVRSPRMHDNLQDIRFQLATADSRSVWPLGAMQKLYAQDTLTISMTSGAADQSIESLYIFYSDLPGVDAELRTWEQIRNRIVNLVTVVVTLTTAATVGDYSATVALNAGAADILKANVNYAWLGAVTDTRIGRVCLRGPDTGNMRTSVPGEVTRAESRYRNIELSKETGLPTIPVINAANKANTLVDCTHVAGGATVIASLMFAELGA